MKGLLVGLLLTLAPATDAAYFRFEPLREITTLSAFKIGDPVNNVAFGAETHVFKHHAEDSYLLIPGVSWSLLDVGVTQPTQDHARTQFILGPSIDLSEPVKALLLKGFDLAYPNADTFPAIRWILQPTPEDGKHIGLSVGPSLAFDPGNKAWARSPDFILHAGINFKFK